MELQTPLWIGGHLHVERLVSLLAVFNGEHGLELVWQLRQKLF